MPKPFLLHLLRRKKTANSQRWLAYLLPLAVLLVSNLPASLHFGIGISAAVAQTVEDRKAEADRFLEMGNQRYRISQWREALQLYESALNIYREIGIREAFPQESRAGEARTLNNIGEVNRSLGNYPVALDYYQQSLVIKREIGDRAGEGKALNSIGIVNQSLGNYAVALDYYQQSLVIAREIGDRTTEAGTLNNIGNVNALLGNYAVALDYYQQSLVIKREIGDRAGEAITLGNIALMLQAQEQTELAIVFFKQSVNKYEVIRESNRPLSQELQKSYTATIADTYRILADLLLQQNRILEAQQVLDLLKVQELDDYLRGVRGIETRLTILRPEEEILQRYNTLQQTAIEAGQELANLRKRLYEEGSLPVADEQRLDQLLSLQEELNNQFSEFLKSDEILALANQLSPTNRQTLEAEERDALFQSLDDLQDNLANLNAVLVYPLILEDRLELIITLPDPETTPLRRTVLVNREDLNRAISNLRQALRDPGADAIDPAQTLYSYLIRPLEAELAEVENTLTDGEPPTIIYAPDGALRYIPLAALHDGNQWLAQRFRINNITAESLTEFQAQPTASPRVLAGAFADPNITYTVPVGDATEEFSGLHFAGQEVQNLVAALPQINSLIDRDFGWTQVRRLMGEVNIVHLATHAAFVPGSPEDSFILFGNGDRAILECLDPSIQTEDSLSCINNWQLNNVDLVVLSACETGLTEQLTNGEEVLGLGYQFQIRGARAVIASLWKVSDGGTQALMDAFYVALQQPGISKSEALQLAQVALITGDFEVLGVDKRSATGIRQRIQQEVPTEIVNRLTHPYYWAPFILIGNGL